MPLSICERNRLQRAPVLAPLAITDTALEVLVVALMQRHGRLDTSRAFGQWEPLQHQHAQMITSLARTLQALLAEYQTCVQQELLAPTTAG
jgi:hypothetical protein